MGDTHALLARAREFSGVAVAIGNNRIRLAKLREFQKFGLSLPVLVHPRAYVADGLCLKLVRWSLLAAIVQPGSVLVRVVL